MLLTKSVIVRIVDIVLMSDDVRICLRKFWFEFLSVKGLRPLKSHKGLCPLTPQAFEKA